MRFLKKLFGVADLYSHKKLPAHDRRWDSTSSISFVRTLNRTWAPSSEIRFSTPNSPRRLQVERSNEQPSLESSGHSSHATCLPNCDSSQDVSYLLASKLSATRSRKSPEILSTSTGHVNSESCEALAVTENIDEDQCLVEETAAQPCESATLNRPYDPQEDGRDENGSECLQTGCDEVGQPGSRAPDPDISKHTPLGFHIPAEKLQRASEAPLDSMEAYWQYTLYQGPGGEEDKVKVHYCKSKESTERVAQLFLDEEVLGFDIEWKASSSAADGISKNVSLIQLASERRVALFHIARFHGTSVNDYVAPTFREIMESPTITKVGVAVKGDCSRLWKFLRIRSHGILELSHLHKLVKYSCGELETIDKKLVSLASQVREHLQLPLWKGEVRSSDWSEDLDYQQTQYAASDSYAGFHLYHVLEAKRLALVPTPPRPAHAEKGLPICLANGQPVFTRSDATNPTSEPTGHMSVSVEELALDFVGFNINDTVGESSHTSPASALPISRLSPSNTAAQVTTTPTQKPPGQTPIKLNHPAVIAANAWAVEYRDRPSPDNRASAKPSELRAYHLHHHQEFSVEDIRRLLRDPPLEPSTVSQYILKAIRVEWLPFDCEQTVELLPFVHISMRDGFRNMISTRTKNRTPPSNDQITTSRV